jgi:hypothetical protein
VVDEAPPELPLARVAAAELLGPLELPPVPWSPDLPPEVPARLPETPVVAEDADALSDERAVDLAAEVVEAPAELFAATLEVDVEPVAVGPVAVELDADVELVADIAVELVARVDPVAREELPDVAKVAEVDVDAVATADAEPPEDVGPPPVDPDPDAGRHTPVSRLHDRLLGQLSPWSRQSGTHCPEHPPWVQQTSPDGHVPQVPPPVLAAATALLAGPPVTARPEPGPEDPVVDPGPGPLPVAPELMIPVPESVERAAKLAVEVELAVAVEAAAAALLELATPTGPEVPPGMSMAIVALPVSEVASSLVAVTVTSFSPEASAGTSMVNERVTGLLPAMEVLVLEREAVQPEGAEAKRSVLDVGQFSESVPFTVTVN